jgi:hypothetical protein
VLAGLTACGDPIHEQKLGALGDEEPGVAPGPLHRPGQPCGVCHGTRGPAERSFVLSGTVYRSPASSLPLPGARVHLLDGRGVQRVIATNCAGNFFLTEAELAPAYPLWVKVEYGEEVVEMRSPISRETSCAACHAQPASPSSVGQVYFWADDAEPVEVAPCD